MNVNNVCFKLDALRATGLYETEDTAQVIFKIWGYHLSFCVFFRAWLSGGHFLYQRLPWPDNNPKNFWNKKIWNCMGIHTHTLLSRNWKQTNFFQKNRIFIYSEIMKHFIHLGTVPGFSWSIPEEYKECSRGGQQKHTKLLICPQQTYIYITVEF